jgi:hypothetical protein
MLFDFRPSGAGGLLLFPDDHLSVVRARREDMAELRVRPGNLPHGASVSVGWADEFGSCTVFGVQERRKASELPFQCLAGAALRLVINYIKDFDGTVRGTCCEALAVVIQLRVVLGKVSASVIQMDVQAGAYDHVLMGRFNGHCV